LTISNQGLDNTSLNAFSGSTVCFLGNDWDFLEVGVKAFLMAPWSWHQVPSTMDYGYEDKILSEL
jgi:hypothetical protein